MVCDKDKKTALEYTSIIQRYNETGLIDRNDVIKRYKQFNADYPEYLSLLGLAAIGHNSLINIDEADTITVVNNIGNQLEYLMGKMNVDSMSMKECHGL